jgi:hypothetical protein
VSMPSSKPQSPVIGMPSSAPNAKMDSTTEAADHGLSTFAGDRPPSIGAAGPRPRETPRGRRQGRRLHR